jgi:hypothetical protein
MAEARSAGNKKRIANKVHRTPTEHVGFSIVLQCAYCGENGRNGKMERWMSGSMKSRRRSTRIDYERYDFGFMMVL